MLEIRSTLIKGGAVDETKNEGTEHEAEHTSKEGSKKKIR